MIYQGRDDYPHKVYRIAGDNPITSVMKLYDFCDKEAAQDRAATLNLKDPDNTYLWVGPSLARLKERNRR